MFALPPSSYYPQVQPSYYSQLQLPNIPTNPNAPTIVIIQQPPSSNNCQSNFGNNQNLNYNTTSMSQKDFEYFNQFIPMSHHQSQHQQQQTNYYNMESGYNTADQVASRCLSQTTSRNTSRLPSPIKNIEKSYNYNNYVLPENQYVSNNEQYYHHEGTGGGLMHNMQAIQNHLSQLHYYSSSNDENYSSDESHLLNSQFDLNNNDICYLQQTSSPVLKVTPVMTENMVDIALNSASHDGSGGQKTSSPKGSRPMQVHIRFPKPRKQDDVYNVRYKTMPCLHYQRKRDCPAGNDCHFAHGPEELRHTNNHTKFRTRFCVNYVRDRYCPYGDECHFRHE